MMKESTPSEKRTVEQQRALNNAMMQAITRGRTPKLLDALYNGADPLSYTSSQIEKTSALQEALYQKNAAMVDILWLAGATLTNKELARLKEPADAAAKRHANDQPLLVNRHRDQSAARIQENPAYKRLYELATGQVELTPESLEHDRGIVFDLDRHLEAVRLSPLPTRIIKAPAARLMVNKPPLQIN